MTWTTLILGAAAVLVTAGYVILMFSRVPALIEDAQARQVAALRNLGAELKEVAETSKQPGAADQGLVARMEELERRMEVVHSDSLRYLQKAAAAEARMNRQPREEDEPELTREEAERLLNGATTNVAPTSQQLSIEEIEAMSER